MSTDEHPAAEPRDGEWPSDWLRATLGILVLKALEPGPSYGYAIIAELETSGFGAVKGGTLYPLLSRFEVAGLVSTQWQAGVAGPGRKFFTLTDRGQGELNRLRLHWRRFAAISDEYLSRSPRDPEGEGG